MWSVAQRMKMSNATRTTTSSPLDVSEVGKTEQKLCKSVRQEIVYTFFFSRGWNWAMPPCWTGTCCWRRRWRWTATGSSPPSCGSSSFSHSQASFWSLYGSSCKSNFVVFWFSSLFFMYGSSFKFPFAASFSLFSFQFLS